MQRWDYATLTLHIPVRGRASVTWQVMDEPEVDLEMVAGVIGLQLAQAGREGWELVSSTTPTPGAGQMFYFKRPAA